MDPQNIYDDDRFFAGYSSLERFETSARKNLGSVSRATEGNLFFLGSNSSG